MKEYNEIYYHDGSLWQLRPAAEAINTYKTVDGIIIGMFQGQRGQFPKIDFIVKILKPGKEEKSFPPLHSLWVVDLMLKINDYKKEVNEIIKFYISFYNKLTPFENAKSRKGYKLVTVNKIVNKYKHIEQVHTLSLEYVSTMIELFCLNEKRTEGAYWFKNLLQKLLDYTENKCDYIDLLRATAPGYR